MPFSAVVTILTAISVVGAIAIPFGDPQLLDRAIALELVFILLAVLIYRGFRKWLYVCMPLVILVMVGNSLAPPQFEIMSTFSKPLNAVVLIAGGYILQAALIGTTFYDLSSRRDIVQKVS